MSAVLFSNAVYLQVSKHRPPLPLPSPPPAPCPKIGPLLRYTNVRLDSLQGKNRETE